MKTLIIYSHPWDGSYNSAILDEIMKTLDEKEAEYEILDLYKEGFNPVLSREELALYNRGESRDPLVSKYQKMIESAERIVFIFPVWWYGLPAILKGFMDKVLLKNWAYDSSSTLPVGKLTHVREALVISTMKAPAWYHKFIFKSTLKQSFIKGTLGFCGLKNIKWFNVANVEKIGPRRREKWLKKISAFAC